MSATVLVKVPIHTHTLQMKTLLLKAYNLRENADGWYSAVVQVPREDKPRVVRVKPEDIIWD